MASNPAAGNGQPMSSEDLRKVLFFEANEGENIQGRPAPWEATRPDVLPAGSANKLRGFLDYNRRPLPYRPAEERLGDWKEVHAKVEGNEREELLHTQAARCMNCGTPFCHQTASGCPLGNKIPEWNDLVHKGRW